MRFSIVYILRRRTLKNEIAPKGQKRRAGWVSIRVQTPHGHLSASHATRGQAAKVLQAALGCSVEQWRNQVERYLERRRRNRQKLFDQRKRKKKMGTQRNPRSQVRLAFRSRRAGGAVEVFCYCARRDASKLRSQLVRALKSNPGLTYVTLAQARSDRSRSLLRNRG